MLRTILCSLCTYPVLTQGASTIPEPSGSVVPVSPIIAAPPANNGIKKERIVHLMG